MRERVPLSAWQPTISGNAALDLSVVPAGKTSALRLSFDFKGGKGFVVARRDWARRMPSEYALHFRLRGRGPVNDLEIKLVDSTGRNVWRSVAKGLAPPRALEAPHDRKPRHRVRMGSGERQRAHRARIHRNRHRGGRGRPGLALDRGSRDRGFDAGAGADGERLERATGIRRAMRPWTARVGSPNRATGGPGSPSIPPVRAISAVSSSIGSGALRPGVFGFARRTPASGGSSSTPPPVREALAATSTRRASRRDSCASICRVPATGAILRMQSFEFSRSIDAFWYAVASGEAARLASALAASRAERVDADRPFERNAVRTDEHRRHGGGGRGVVLARAHAEDRRGSSSPGRTWSPRLHSRSAGCPCPRCHGRPRNGV